MKLKASRLFVALFPPDALIHGLAEHSDVWKPQLPDPRLKWSPPENLHLTLCFLGGVPEDRIPELESALRSVPANGPIQLKLKGLGVFPGHQRPKVLWAGIEGELEAVASLQSAVRNAAEPFLEKPDAKPFAPHLTLARIKDGDGRLGRAVRRLAKAEAETDFGGWTADRLQLMRSETASDRSRYVELASFRIAG